MTLQGSPRYRESAAEAQVPQVHTVEKLVEVPQVRLPSRHTGVMPSCITCVRGRISDLEHLTCCMQYYGTLNVSLLRYLDSWWNIYK